MVGNWDVLWSLSVEEVFYLFFPLLCVVLRKQKYLIIALLFFVVAGPINRTIYADNDLWGDYAYLSCMDGIAIGCLAAMFASKIRSRKTIYSLLISGLLLFCFTFFFRKQVFNLGLTSINLNVTLLEIGIAFILIASQQIKINYNLPRLFGFKPIQWFGRNSYEIYLTHGMIITLVVNVIYQANQPLWLTTIEYLMIVLAAGMLGHLISSKYSEPLNQYLRNKSRPITEKVSYSSEG